MLFYVFAPLQFATPLTSRKAKSRWEDKAEPEVISREREDDSPYARTIEHRNQRKIASIKVD